MTDTFDLEALVDGLSARELVDGLTAQELAVRIGRNVNWVRDRLALLNAQGLLLIGKKKVQDLSGRQVFVPAYKIKPQQPAKSGKAKRG